MATTAAIENSLPPVAGLPAGAEVEGDRVFFVYRREAEKTEIFDEDFYRNRFKKEAREERDEIGVVKDGAFQPNDYFLKWHPAADQRPAHRWKNACQRQKAYCERYTDWTSGDPKLPPEVAADYAMKGGGLAQSLAVGFTDYAADQLWTNGVAEAILCGAFEGDAKAAADLMNLVLGFWPEAALMPLAPEEVAKVCYDRAAQRYIGEKPFAQGVRPLLTRLGARTGFLKRFADARSDAAAARDTMVIIDGPRGIAVRTALDDPEILGIHAFQKPKRWTKELLKSIVEALNAGWDPVYCLRDTLTAEDYHEVMDAALGGVFAEAQWSSPVVEGFMKEFADATLLEHVARRGKPAAAVSVPGARLGKKSEWFQYTFIHDEYRGAVRVHRTMNRCDQYADAVKTHPGLACPPEVAPWIIRGSKGELSIENSFRSLAESWRWEVIAGPRDETPFDEAKAARLWKTAESLRLPLSDLMECLEQSGGLNPADGVTPEREAAVAAAALGAVIVAKFRRQSQALEILIGLSSDDGFGCDSSMAFRLLRGLRGTTLEPPERRYGVFAELYAGVAEPVDDPGYVLGMSQPFFDSMTGILEKLSPAFLKNVARRFADSVHPQPPVPVILDPAAFCAPASLERLDEFFAGLGRKQGRKPLGSLFVKLAETVKAYWGATAPTEETRLMAHGYSADDAGRMAERLEMALSAAKRFALDMKDEPLTPEGVAKRIHAVRLCVQATDCDAPGESIRIFLSALAGAVEAMPLAKVKEEALVFARLAREVAGR